MHAERRARVPGAVLWVDRTEGPGRVLPDGCMDLLWDGRALVVAGPDTHALLTDLPVGSRTTGLRFAPGAAPSVLGVPAVELRDARTPLADLWGRRADELAERLAGAAGGDARGDDASGAAALEALALDLWRASPEPDRATTAVAGLLRAGTPAAAVASAVGLGERQLHRRCLSSFGYGPSVLARVLRLQDALALARDGVRLADVAARCGYADQPHLARDVRALAGTTLTALLR